MAFEMTKYRKKPVVIDAVQWDGDMDTRLLLEEVMGKKIHVDFKHPRLAIVISTLEGDMTALADDWIIKGVKGEFYPCKPDIFEMTYDLA